MWEICLLWFASDDASYGWSCHQPPISVYFHFAWDFISKGSVNVICKLSEVFTLLILFQLTIAVAGCSGESYCCGLSHTISTRWHRFDCRSFLHWYPSCVTSQNPARCEAMFCSMRAVLLEMCKCLIDECQVEISFMLLHACTCYIIRRLNCTSQNRCL